jgi:hypothetical protein
MTLNRYRALCLLVVVLTGVLFLDSRFLDVMLAGRFVPRIWVCVSGSSFLDIVLEGRFVPRSSFLASSFLE